MNLAILCDKIQLQNEIREEVTAYSKSNDFRKVLPHIGGLKNMETKKQLGYEINP